jgi:type VI secretion system protein ImpF
MPLSLLDRLTDLEPQLKRDAASGSWDESRAFKASLCRDLGVLLNTRRAQEDFDPAYAEATGSLLTFGVADFTSFNLKNLPEQERVRRSIERAIREFEPRLARVTVLLEPPDLLKPELRFQISAVLKMDSDAEPVMFDATLRRDSRRIAVSGANS